MLKELNELFSRIENTSEPVVAGIDEAGRGPVIGPMVYGLYVCRPSIVTKYKDSKLLTAVQREQFFNSMENFAYYKVSPEYITSHMMAESKDLNEIARDAVIELLHELQLKCKNVQTVYIDGLGNNEKYKSILQKKFDYNFIIENKADSKYQAVSGASIVAKVTRDRFISEWSASNGFCKCGSGYPSDPITSKWLREYNYDFRGFPNYVRHSWKTIKNILGVKKDRRLKNSLSGFFTGPN